MLYSYDRITLHENTSTPLSIFLGNITHNSSFKSGLYGITVMPTESQRAVNANFSSLPSTCTLIDETRIVSEESIADQMKKVSEFL